METANKTIIVWDRLIRIFHWSLVAAFFLAYLTEDDILDLHVAAGYYIGALLLIRLVWGFIGSKHARFRNFLYSPSVVIDYLRKLPKLQAPRYVGHNPAGGAMIFALLGSLILTVCFGLITYGSAESAGILAPWLAGSPEWLGDIAKEIHEFFANFTLLLVAVHVGGVIVDSFIHGENLVRAMVTGEKKSEI